MKTMLNLTLMNMRLYDIAYNYAGLGLANRSCLANGVWGPVDARNCESTAVREVRLQVSTIVRCISALA